MDQWEVKIKSIKYPKKQEIEVLIKKTTKIKINNEIFSIKSASMKTSTDAETIQVN